MRKQVVLWLLPAFLFALFMLSPAARAGDTVPRLVFGEGKLTPTSSDESGGKSFTLTLPIYLQNTPDEGICAVLFWVEIAGDGGVGEINVESDVSDISTTGDIAVTYAVSADDSGKDGVILCGILIDSKENFDFPTGGELCRMTLHFQEGLTLSFIGGSVTYVDKSGVIRDVTVASSSPHYIYRGDPFSTQAQTEVIFPAETLANWETVPEPPTNADTHAIVTPVGVQDTAAQGRRAGDTSYAVRFLFTSENRAIPAGASAVCLSGGGLLKLSFAVNDFVLSCNEGEQAAVPPPKEGSVWLSYTFEGLSYDGVYEFEIDGGDGKRFQVIYRDGRCEMP